MATIDKAWARAMLLAAALANLASLPAAAGAQTVYKCSVHGVSSYGDTPCAQGVSIAMPALPYHEFTAADRARLERERQRAAAIDRAHAKEQAAEDQRSRQAARARAAQDKKCAALKLAQQWAREDAAGLQGRAAERAARKVERRGQSLALTCPV
jgi:hypothetical protein